MNRQDTRQRAVLAERMHATGATWQEVADRLGFRSRQGAATAVQRLRDKTPAESVEQARAKHDAALRLLQQRNFTRYLDATAVGDDDTAVKYSKEIRSTVSERAKLAGAYAPQRAELDVSVEHDAGAAIERLTGQLLDLAAGAVRPQPVPIDAERVKAVEA